ncbi:hypothetical protein [Aquabacter sediminis]|uniref:hypothetical protein n=1 Tax=Aquabacter sediminis TaxID=3029197 RepID=UPI00237E870A|nr:hypothetical protein [Aquabacter sp. P-9]MDE1568044.1 hypothetical protein [Aquabacter sp. P-9]
MSDHQVARLILDALPPTKCLIAHRGDGSACFREALAVRGVEPRIPSSLSPKRPLALELNFAMHDDIAEVGNTDGLGEVLVGHFCGKVIVRTQLGDRVDRARHQQGRKANRGLGALPVPKMAGTVSELKSGTPRPDARSGLCRHCPERSPA